ncbi:hypothetical protein ACFLXB_07065 [Chloroflexota bacterium]
MKKNKRQFQKILIILLTACFVLAGCAPAAQSTPVVDQQPTNITSPSETPTNVASHTPGPSPTATTYYTPTPDLRLKPEQWQQWPVIPEISPNAIQIYERGLGLGNDPHAFSKVGDCQNIPESFLGIYDRSGAYDLTDQFQYLQDSIDFFAGSFSRESQAVRGGFTAPSVLLPLWADPVACNSGETPLECEIRIHNPSILILSMEFWFQGRTPESYAGYMRQIIDYTLSKGVLPVLATKADNVEGDHSINLTIAQLAYEYDIPLWNFWRSVQNLPGQGIDWERDIVDGNPEGFHITVDAWNMRSFTALQVLDAIRNAVSLQPAVTPVSTGDALVQTPDPAFSPSALDSLPYSSAQPFSAVAANLPGILFDLSRNSLDLTEKLGIFTGDLNAGKWFALAAPGLTLLDLSADGDLLLARFMNDLYSINLANGSRRLLTDQLVVTDPQPAYFLPDGRTAAILATDNDTAVYLLSINGQQRLTQPGEFPLGLVPSRLVDRVYWQTGSCLPDSGCTLENLFVTQFFGEAAEAVNYPGVVSISPDGTLAFVQSSENAWNYLTLVQGSQNKSVYVPGNRLIDMAWSPDGTTLALSTVTVSSYTGKATDNWHTLVRWPAVSTALYLVEGRVTEKLAWSADGKSLLVLRRENTDTGYDLNFNQVDVNSNLILPGGFSLKTEQYLTISKLFLLDQ